MNTILAFLVEVTMTLILAVLLVRYLHPFLIKILVDLCGTEDRARFWSAFSNILLIGMPLIFSLNFNPQAETPEKLFFEMGSKLSGNAGGFLLALIGIGFIVSFFSLVARRPAGA
jgi:uncharacterized membrane protein YhaH (DUF805 family)